MRRPLYKQQPQVIIHNHQQEVPSEVLDKKPMHKVIAYTGRYENVKDILKKFASEDVEVIVIYNHPNQK